MEQYVPLGVISNCSCVSVSGAPGNSWEQLLLGGRSCGRRGSLQQSIIPPPQQHYKLTADFRAHIEQNTQKFVNIGNDFGYNTNLIEIEIKVFFVVVSLPFIF